MPCPPSRHPIACGLARSAAAMSRPSWNPGRRHGTHTTRSPKHALVSASRQPPSPARSRSPGEAIADEFGSVVRLCNPAQDTERERRHLDMLEQQRVQGVLVSPVDTAVVNWSGLTRRGIPVVLVDRIAAAGNMCSVAVDDVLGGDSRPRTLSSRVIG